MGGFRAERVADQIHREVSMRLARDIKDPRMVPISITSVTVTRDLRRAVIEFLPLGGGEITPELTACLKDVSKALRGPIGRALRISHAPEIVFQRDTHTEEAIRVTSLLDKIGRELNPTPPEPEDPEETP
jgi:ribosome-binding factor A